MLIRPATLADLDTIVYHRRTMFQEMGYVDQQKLDEMSARFRPWVAKKMEAGEYLTWFAISPDQVIAAGLGLWLMDWPPHMVAGGRWRGNILNVYTEPAYRRMGLARDLMKAAMGWCAANDVGAVILHSSPAGRALYESLGFEATNEMRRLL